MIYFMDKNERTLQEGHINELETFQRTIDETRFCQADGDELIRACEILGRPLPRNQVFTFVDDAARTIAYNWY